MWLRGYTADGECLKNLIEKHYSNPTFIDRVIAPHNDGDHAGVLAPRLEYFKVGELWMLRPWKYAKERIKHKDVYGKLTLILPILKR